MTGIGFYRDEALPFFELKLCQEYGVAYKKHAHEVLPRARCCQGSSFFDAKAVMKILHHRRCSYCLRDVCTPVNRWSQDAGITACCLWRQIGCKRWQQSGPELYGRSRY